MTLKEIFKIKGPNFKIIIYFSLPKFLTQTSHYKYPILFLNYFDLIRSGT